MVRKCICCGHVFEHMAKLQARVQTQRRALAPAILLTARCYGWPVPASWDAVPAGRLCLFVVFVGNKPRLRLRERIAGDPSKHWCERHTGLLSASSPSGCVPEQRVPAARRMRRPRSTRHTSRPGSTPGWTPTASRTSTRRRASLSRRRPPHCLQTVWRLQCLRAVWRPCAGRRRTGGCAQACARPAACAAEWARRRLSVRATAAAQVHEAIRADPMPQPKERVKPDEMKRWKTPKLTYDERKAQLKARGDVTVLFVVTLTVAICMPGALGAPEDRRSGVGMPRQLAACAHARTGLR